MNFVFWFILSIDFLIMIMHYLYSIEMVKKNKLFSKIKERNDKVSKDMEEKIPSSVLGKVIYGVLTLIVVVFFIAFLTSIIWLPIIMWIFFNWQSGLIAFMLISAILSLLLIFIYVKLVPGYVLKEGAIVKEAIYVSFFVLLSIFIKYGSPFPLDQMVEIVYTQSSVFNSTLSVLVPVLIIGLMLTNIYLFINGLAYIVDKSKKIVKARTKIIDILTIFTFSSFFALFYVVDRDWSYLNLLNTARHYETIDVFKNLLVAVLVPLILSRFISANSKEFPSSSNSTMDNIMKVEKVETDSSLGLVTDMEEPKNESKTKDREEIVTNEKY